MKTLELVRAGTGAFACCLLIGLLPSAVSTPMLWHDSDTCSVSGLAPYKNDTGAPHVVCSGGCTEVPDPSCKERKRTDSMGDYWFCSCTADYEAPCCHLVARKQESTWVLDVRGLCTHNSPSCAAKDGLTCQLLENQPVCKDPPPPPHTGG
jgi:hypothetical protein